MYFYSQTSNNMIDWVFPKQIIKFQNDSVITSNYSSPIKVLTD